jgi:uncharacterized protein (TIGR00730 family)
MESIMKNVCIYASSSNGIEQVYFDKTSELAALVAQKNWGLIYGGGMTGLMGAMARGMTDNGGHITGVIPERLNRKNIVYEHCDELIVTETMRERKSIMEERADAFIALPGGFGTMEELLEIITLKQLKYHKKPIVIMNINHYYEGIQSIFQKMMNEHFAKKDNGHLYYFAEEPEDAVQHIENYVYRDIGTKLYPLEQ